MRRRSWGTFQFVSRARSLPATWILPVVGRSSLRTSRRNVDLPDPDGPTKKTNSPFSTSRFTFSKAGRPWFAYVFVTLSKWITGPSHLVDNDSGCDRAVNSCPGLVSGQSRGETGLERPTSSNWPDGRFVG